MTPEPDSTAIKLVAIDGHRMPLKKEERLEAIRIMAAHNIPRENMAWRLCLSITALEASAGRAKIKLPPIKPPAHWTSGYIDSRNREARKREAERKRQLRRTTKNTN